MNRSRRGVAVGEENRWMLEERREEGRDSFTEKRVGVRLVNSSTK
jgi:hypothetical protein